MKYSILILFIGLTVSLYSKNIPSLKLTTASQIEMAVKNYEVGLNYDNNGLVESTICNVLKFKYQYPEADMSDIEETLNKISRESNNKKIQAKATLVIKIMNNPEMLSEIGKKFFYEMDQFLDVLLISTLFQPDSVVDLSSRKSVEINIEIDHE